MKTNHVLSYSLSLAAGSLLLVSGCVIVADRPPEPPRPRPVVVETVMVPASYVIVDGIYFGWVGERYYYLGSGGVWLLCDAARLEHFHHWERSHRDWREHAIRNDHFRRDAQGHEHPRPDDSRVQPGGHNDPRMQPGGRNDPRVQPGGYSGPHVQPGRSDSHVQPGSSAPHAAQPSPSQIDARIQTSRSIPSAQPSRAEPRAAQPGNRAPAKAAPSNKLTDKDDH